MDKRYDHKIEEPKILDLWKKNDCFKGIIDKKKKPFTIVLPPPNASGKLHVGNDLMLAIEDVLIRWKKMQGYSTLWLPGTDHAGFETQIVFERELREEGKSRFDYDRDTLYQKIWDFVEKNKGDIDEQMTRMGAGLDWSRYTYTLDDHVVDTVYTTFQKMVDDNLIYRDNYIVNYCPKCGTTFADLELKHITRKDPLYYMKYGPFTLATVRPETKFGDTAVAVNPKDKRYKEYIGKEIEVEGLLGSFKLKVIADHFVDPEFGTGVVKVTPAHDKNDYEAGLRHNLEVKPVIGLDGKLNDKCGPYEGMKVMEAREKVVDDLKAKGLLVKIDEEYEHVVSVCYKGGHDVEPTVLPNWFVSVGKLKKPALEIVKKGKVRIFPKWREVTYTRWIEEMRDWPISRQIVWGIRIPAWYSVKDNPKLLVTFIKGSERITGKISELLMNHSFGEIEKGLQNLIAPKDAKYIISKEKLEGEFLPETDTFDTWFSSGHWPLVTLHYPDSEDFKYFYPTSVMETGWEILRFWVSRMIMFGIYLTGNPPFNDVYLHGLVRAIDGKKMSKSLGNVVNPEEYIEEYGVDALRMGLISGTANGKDFAFPKDKVVSYRNFANKLWNMARFMLLMMEDKEISFYDGKSSKGLQKEDKEILKKLKETIKSVNDSLEKYRFSEAAELAYHFMWDDLASSYIEHVKDRQDKEFALSIFRYVFVEGLKILHPFMPFVTEAIWQNLPKNDGESEILLNSIWPE
ncbi:valine--tRNA ligase [Patescibacteria group bacterium]|nr:valine--tRNA ligase [Patescibacteria group bacterium]